MPWFWALSLFVSLPLMVLFCKRWTKIVALSGCRLVLIVCLCWKVILGISPRLRLARASGGLLRRFYTHNTRSLCLCGYPEDLALALDPYPQELSTSRDTWEVRMVLPWQLHIWHRLAQGPSIHGPLCPNQNRRCWHFPAVLVLVALAFCWWEHPGWGWVFCTWNMTRRSRPRRVSLLKCWKISNVCRWSINSYVTIFMATELMLCKSGYCPTSVLCTSSVNRITLSVHTHECARYIRSERVKTVSWFILSRVTKCDVLWRHLWRHVT